MIKPIVKDVMFLGQVSEPSTKEDAQVARDLGYGGKHDWVQEVYDHCVCRAG